MKPVILAACLFAPAGVLLAAELPKEFAGYEAWKPTTEAPYGALSFNRCVPGSGFPVEDGGPHSYRFISVYVSPAARDVWTDKTKPFPVGTMIVKEKRRQSADKQPSELGVMIKREAGWEYLFVDQKRKLFLGAETKNCAKCHAAAKDDSVFGRVGPVYRK